MKRHTVWAVVTVAVGLVAAAGCGRSEPNFSKFIPNEEKARAALEAALTSWQSGQKPGQLELGKTAVEVVDSKWGAGQKLSSFEIVSEEKGEGPRWFSVKLKLSKPAGEQVVRYVVVGKSPVWVYREEDYKRSAGM